MLVMKNAAKFISYFPAPQKRTKLDWQIIDRYMKMWHNEFQEEIERQKEEEFIRHITDNFMFDENEKFF